MIGSGIDIHVLLFYSSNSVFPGLSFLHAFDFSIYENSIKVVHVCK